MRLKLNSELSFQIMTGLAVMLWSASFTSAKVIKGDANAKREAEMKEYTEKVGNGEGEHVLVPIKAGVFTLGSPKSEDKRKEDEGPQIKVKIEPFWMGKYEVTWDAFKAFRDEYFRDDQNRENLRKAPAAKQADAVTIPTVLWDRVFGAQLERLGQKGGYPVGDVSQYGARQFTKWLSKKTGRFYRLPTEAEWEYACRAGTNSAYSFGNNEKDLTMHAWYYDNSEYDDPKRGQFDTGCGYRKVGSRKPNPWGLHDMHGNIGEWTIDEYRADHYVNLKKKYGKNVVDWKDAIAWPTSETAFPHVIRGGHFLAYPEECRSTYRLKSSPDLQDRDPMLPKGIFWYPDAFHIGLRIVRPLTEPTEKVKRKFWDTRSPLILEVLKNSSQHFRIEIKPEK